MLVFWTRFAGILTLVMGLLPAIAQACPMCTPIGQTFTEEIAAVQVGVIARLIETAPPVEPGATPAVDPSADKAKFEIVRVLKGAEHVGETKQIEVVYHGQQPKGAAFLILGLDPPKIAWNAPAPLSERAVEYLGTLLTAPPSGGDRLAWFQEYLEHTDELLARDAFDEFAKAPYADVKDLKDRMQHDKFVAWIRDAKVSVSSRRLYLTMLGVCGTHADVPMLEELITREEPAGEPKTALDALIACYLTLKGPAGMPLILDKFIENQDCGYPETYAAIMALRFHGQEENVIPREQLAAGLRHILDRSSMADLIIPDLARWEDWGSRGRLVRMFKDADEKTSFVRVPIVQFLRACPLPEAAMEIAELEKIDPEAVKRADANGMLGALVSRTPAPVPPPAKTDKTPADATLAAAELPPQPVADIEPHEPLVNLHQVAYVLPEANASAQMPTTLAMAIVQPAGSSWILFVPVGVGLGLLALLVLIVRCGVGQTPAGES